MLANGTLEYMIVCAWEKEGSKENTNFQFTLGASETAFTVDGPMGKKTSYIFSVRRSYLQFLFSAFGLPFLPTFSDYQFKVKTNFDESAPLGCMMNGCKKSPASWDAINRSEG